MTTKSEGAADAAITIIAPKSIAEVRELATDIEKGTVLPEALRGGRKADLMIIMMTGAELGFGPMLSLRTLQVVKGKPSLSAEAMLGLCLARKDVCEYFHLVSSDAIQATFVTKRVGAPREVSLSFTFEDAKRARLTEPGKNGEPSMYTKYGPVMLRWRCVSQLARTVYADVVLGLQTVDEAEEIELNEAPKPASANNTTAAIESALRSQVEAERKAEEKKALPPAGAQVIDAPKAANVVPITKAPAASPPSASPSTSSQKPATAAKKPSPGADEILLSDGKLVKIVDATNEQLTTAHDAGLKHLEKNPKATWAADLKKKVELIELEMANRQDALNQALTEAPEAPVTEAEGEEREPGSDG